MKHHHAPHPTHTEEAESHIQEAASVESAPPSEGHEALKDALEAAESKAADYWDRLLRKEAEMQNVQRRAKQDIENAHKFALENFSKELLVVLDTFERAIDAGASASADLSAMVEGVRLTHKLLLDILEKFHVTPVAPEAGDAFNPTYHQAILHQENGNYPPNSVVHLAQKGYLLHGRLLRPAHVVVSK